MHDLKNLQSEWQDGELTSWTCEICNWKRLATDAVDIKTIGMALAAYLEHQCVAIPELVAA